MNYFTLEQRRVLGHTKSPDSEWILNLPQWLYPPQDCSGTPGDWQRPQRRSETWDPNAFAFAWREDGEKPDFPVTIGGLHAASMRMRDITEQLAPGCVEFLPFRTRTSRGLDVTTGYSVMRYLMWCDALDREKCQFDDPRGAWTESLEDGRDFYLKKVVLRRDKLTSPVCRIVGFSSYHLYREDIVGALSAAGITGTVFNPVDCV